MIVVVGVRVSAFSHGILITMRTCRQRRRVSFREMRLLLLVLLLASLIGSFGSVSGKVPTDRGVSSAYEDLVIARLEARFRRDAPGESGEVSRSRRDARFRTKTLKLFNDCRELMAAGSISRIMGLIALASEGIFGKGYAPIGPAANMFRLYWSRDLEQIAFEQSNEGLFSINAKEGYAMFKWQGSIIDMIRDLVKAFPLDFFLGKTGSDAVKKIIETIMDILEAILTLMALATSYPSKFPIPANEDIGCANALYAERTEIGCYDHLLYAVCVLKKIPADRDRLFKLGVACSACPEDSRCEITERDDGWYEEGDLCTPWANEKPDPVKEARLGIEDYDEEFGDIELEPNNTATHHASTNVPLFVASGFLLLQ